jgi:FecR protein
MCSLLHRTVLGMGVCTLLPILGAAVLAQTSRCRVTTFTDPPRDVLQCGSVSVAAERATQHRLIDRDGDGVPEGAEVSGRALLTDVAPRRRGGFQILTPHAVASVRGTIFAVDVESWRTSVFVAEGSVSVSRRDGSSSVTLRSGQGVDVMPGQPLEVKTWGQERALGLLGRFGR